MPRKRTAKRPAPSLRKILLVLIAGAVCLLGVYRAFNWYQGEYLGNTVGAAVKEDLATARALYADGEFESARELLLPLAQRVTSRDLADEVYLLLAQAERAAGDLRAAADTANRAITTFPDSALRPRLQVLYARCLEGLGERDSAVALYEQVRDTAPPEFRAPALSGLAAIREAQGELTEARELYRQAERDAPWGGENWAEAVEGLGRVNVALVFSPIATDETRVYTVQSGDTLTDIGNRLNVTQGMLERANNLQDRSYLDVGQRLLYTAKDFRIVIERSTCRLFLLDKNGIFKVYSVGLGKPGQETTLGRYKVGNKQKDPTWFKPGEGPIPFGDPRNELGTRWMPLIPVDEGLPRDLGIHGTIAPETIGSFSSSGCARMLNEEVEELYDLVVRSTPVDIVEVFEPADAQPEGDRPAVGQQA